MSLTLRQSQVLQFVADYQTANNGVSPSYDLISDHIGANSKSMIYRILNALEERGFITRLPNRARAITVLKTSAMPSGCCPTCGRASQ